MNKAMLMGRLTRDPEVRYSQGANPMAIARFSIAVDRRFKRQGEPEADFFNCTAFGKQAEFIEKYLKKGTKMVVIGRLQNDTYTNKEGQKVYAVNVMVEELEFAESKSASGTSSSSATDVQNGGFQGNINEGFTNIPEGLAEELPFM